MNKHYSAEIQMNSVRRDLHWVRPNPSSPDPNTRTMEANVAQSVQPLRFEFEGVSSNHSSVVA